MPRTPKGRLAPRERILRRAAELFYARGFANTGVRDIVKGARTVAATFYDHFPSKHSLGIAYVKIKAALLTENLLGIIEISGDVRSTLHKWADFKRQQVLSGKFLGCPVAAFAYHSGELPKPFQNELRATAEQWHTALREYLDRAVEQKELRREIDTDAMARRLLLVYEGALAMWKLTRDPRYIDDMEAVMLQEYERARV